MKNSGNVQVEVAECAICGKSYGVEELRIIDGQHVCVNCHDKYFFECEHCGETHRRDLEGSVNVIEGSNARRYTEEWCMSCAESDAHFCADCEELISDACIRWVNYENGYVCEDCIEADYAECAECGELVPCRDMYESRRHYEDVCQSCHDEEADDVVIHDYHDGIKNLCWLNNDCIPSWEVDRDYRLRNLFVGVELEIDNGGEFDENAREIVEAGGHGVDYDVTCESDGSLNRGFEIISTTATINYHLHDYRWDDMMARAQVLSYTSHDAGTCGLHVHLDREYFTGASVDAELAMTLLLTNNSDWLIPFSRRSNFRYCNFPCTYEEHGEKVLDFKPFTVEEFASDALKPRLCKLTRFMRGHYRALNFEGKNTIEVRFNRGTLKFSTFVATLQFVQLFADVVKNAKSLEELCGIGLDQFVGYALAHRYSEFLIYLQERGILKGKLLTYVQNRLAA